MDGRFGVVRADRAGADRVLEVTAERGVRGGDLAHRAAHPPGDARARPLDRAADPARTAAGTERPGERRHELVELVPGALGATEVGAALGVLDLLLELADPRPHLAARALVEHGVGAGRLVAAAGELETVQLL